MRNQLAAMSAVVLAAGSLFAAPLNPNVIPANAKWVAHVDMDRIKATQLGVKIIAEGNKQKEAITKEANPGAGKLMETYKFDFARDVKGISVYGLSPMSGAAKPSDCIALCYTTFDSTKLLADIKALPGCQVVKYGDYTIVPLPDGVDEAGKLKAAVAPEAYACFFKELVVVGATVDMVKNELDTLGSKKSAMKVGAPGAEWLGTSKGAVFFAMGHLPEKSKAAGADSGAMMPGMNMPDPKNVRFTLDEATAADGIERRVKADLVLGMKTAEDATKMQVTLQVLMGMMTMGLSMDGGLGRGPSPEIKKAVLQVIQGITFGAQAKETKISLAVSSATLSSLVDEAVKSIPQAMMRMHGGAGMPAGVGECAAVEVKAAAAPAPAAK